MLSLPGYTCRQCSAWNRTIQICTVTSLRVSPEEVVQLGLDCPLMMIEQVLMRSMKTSGGITRGRGMTEQQWLTSLLSMPACSETNRAMQELTGVKYITGEQNKEMGKTRQHRDKQDTHTLQLALVDRNPFKIHTAFRNIRSPGWQ